MKEPINVLLVDDQPGKLLSYEVILAPLGENLLKASSGREALELMLKTEVPVVLMDVSMPEINGFALAEIIHEHPRFSKTAIIFVSAVHLSDVDRIKAYESGAVDYVSVPVIPEILRAKVGVFAELHRKTRDAERLNRELETRVTARTAALEVAVEQQTRLTERLQEADRRKDEFLALLAHELRNPLAPLISAADIIEQRPTADLELQRCRAMIQRQVRQLTRLVDDLLDVSRITLGKINLRTEKLDLGQAIAAAIEISQPLIDKHRHQLQSSLPALPVHVEGDMTRLTQVVSNLLNNAARYQRDGGSIDVKLTVEGESAVIRVSDRGMGIPAGILPRVFDLFTQGEHTQGTQAAGGLGVGLSLVKTVVEMHGGSVTAHSAGAGHGSEFRVRLPLHIPGHKAGARAVVQALPAPGKASRVDTGWQVLVVDDNVDAAESLAALLRMDGHQVCIAHEGHAALEAVMTSTPDILLLDIGLPGMDGFEICCRARQIVPPEAMIVAITGYGRDQDRERAQAAGFDALVVKPVEIAELMALLEQLREKTRQKSRHSNDKLSADLIDPPPRRLQSMP